MKQLVPTGLDEFIAEHKPGDPVTGRIIKLDGRHATIELGDGVFATCTLPEAEAAKEEPKPAAAAGGALDLSAFSSMLNAKWKTGTSTAKAKPEAPQAGQVRHFRIATLNPATKSLTVDLVS
jgi:small subunit ribosomal protein S1